jgi:hypothetical protein
MFRSGSNLKSSREKVPFESFHSLEGNMCGTVMRGADVLPGSKATSRAKGSYRNLGYLAGCALCRDPQQEGELDTDADIRSSFDTVSQEWLIRFVEPLTLLARADEVIE